MAGCFNDLPHIPAVPRASSLLYRLMSVSQVISVERELCQARKSFQSSDTVRGVGGAFHQSIKYK